MGDGVFLKPLSMLGFKTIGVDPATKVVSPLVKEGYDIYNDFFDRASADKIWRERGEVAAIATSNSFAHIDAMEDVMEGVKLLLKQDGILAIQVHYAVAMVRDMQYDWIYHEHMSYYSLFSLSNFLMRHGFEVFKAAETPMHGGSIRVFAQRASGNTKRPIESSVLQMREVEKNLGVHDIEFYRQFERKMASTRRDIRDMLSKIKQQGAKVVGYGAPARATTLSSYIGISFMKEHLTSVIDDAPSKQGMFTPGTNLPIVSSSILQGESRPDYVFVYAWPWQADIVQKQRAYLESGGSLIFPLPKVRLFTVHDLSR